MKDELGQWFMMLGLLLLAVGALIWLLGDSLGRLGHLPGDVRMERENFSFYFPVTTIFIFEENVYNHPGDTNEYKSGGDQKVDEELV